MENLFLVAVSLSLGLLVKRLPGFPVGAHQGINAFVVFVALPAAVLLHLSKISFGWRQFLPLSMGLVVFLGAVAFVWVLGQLRPLSAVDRGCLLLLTGFGNTSFVGFPLVEMYYGSEALGVAVLADQGSFVVLATLGLAAATWYAGERPSAKLLATRLLQFPPFWAFIIATQLAALGWGLTGLTAGIAAKLAATLTPLALFSVGLQLHPQGLGHGKLWLLMALGYKLLIAPTLVWAVYGWVLSGTELRVTVLEAAMGPMATAGILAAQYKLNATMAARILGIGILVSLGTTWLWVRLLTFLSNGQI